MTFNPGRLRGNGVAGAHARQDSADRHTGDRKEFLRRHEWEAATAARGTAEMKSTFIQKLLQRTADTRNLRLAWDYFAAGDGQAPGLDGLRFSDLEDQEVWSLLRTVSKAIHADTYRVAPDRQKLIPKASGKGTRVLSIPSIVDRVVQRAIVQTTQPSLDVQMDARSLGYRPHAHVYQALALAEELTMDGERWVWVTEDLADAFNHVPQRRLLDLVGNNIPNAGMLRLIERVVLTETGKGLRQGGNLSPMLLNLYLDHFLDRQWRKLHPEMPLIRWADDLLILCRKQQEAMQAYSDLQRLLRPTGMTLKGTPERNIHDLRSGSADWLGYRLHREGTELEASMTETAWKNLSTKLELDHEKDSSSIRAIQTIKGWSSQMGPCFETMEMTKAYARIGSLAMVRAFDEIPSYEEVRQSWLDAYRRWCRSRKAGAMVKGKLAGGAASRNCETGGTCRPGIAS